jgi:hypothetical protein
MRRTLGVIVIFLAAFPLCADPLYTVTVRGLRQDFPLIAWQMTYKITAATQAEAEHTALQNARRDGCEAASAHIVEMSVTLSPGDSRPVTPIIIVTPPAQASEHPPRIDYQEAYQAGYDHGVTGFITGRGAVILNHEIPEKYRLAEQEQGYKNGYAKGYAEEQAKAERRVRRPSPPPSRPDPRR